MKKVAQAIFIAFSCGKLQPLVNCLQLSGNQTRHLDAEDQSTIRTTRSLSSRTKWSQIFLLSRFVKG